MVTRNMRKPKALATSIDEAATRLYPHRFAVQMSGGWFVPFPHIAHISRQIAAAVQSGGGRLIINMPPGHGKSSLLSLWTPTWFLDNNPAGRVILTSHGAELAAVWGRAVRNEFEQNPRLSTRLSEDSSAANRWNTPEGGGMKTDGVGGGITGFRANLLLVDDPHPTWEAAQSATQRRRVAEWMTGTLTDRAEPNATIILLMHRWHEDDLTGFLVSEHPERWKVIRLPALAEPGDSLGRKEGEALCPQRYGRDALIATRADVGEVVYGAKYQQNPSLVGSGRAYHKFIPAMNEDKGLRLRRDLPLQLAWDFNVNPGVHVIVGQYDSHRDLFTAVYEIHGPRMKTRPAMVELRKVITAAGGWKQFPEVHVFGDRSGNTETTTTTDTDYQIIAEELRADGVKYRMRVQTANPPIKTRLLSFNEALSDANGEVHYVVHPLNCPRLTRDLKQVKEDEEGLIDKGNTDLTHPSDADGYRVTYLRPAVKREAKTGQPKAVPQPA